MSGMNKVHADRNARVLQELLQQPGNDCCADCKGKAPRWASHNLGIFLCVRCASIHRKIGTHITKVKSVTMDTWTKEQVDVMKNMGNIKSNQYYNPDERKNPLPYNFEESERDSELEKYIRAKYEFKRFASRSAKVAEKLGPSQSLADFRARSPRFKSSPSPSPSTSAGSLNTGSPSIQRTTTPSIPRTESPAASLAASTSGSLATLSHPARAATLPLSSHSQPQIQISSLPSAPLPQTSQVQTQTTLQRSSGVSNNTWNDLISLQAPGTNSSLPLQYTQANSLPTLSAAPSIPQTNFTPSPTPQFSQQPSPPVANPYLSMAAPNPSFGSSFVSTPSNFGGMGMTSMTATGNHGASGFGGVSSPLGLAGNPFHALGTSTPSNLQAVQPVAPISGTPFGGGNPFSISPGPAPVPMHTPSPQPQPYQLQSQQQFGQQQQQQQPTFTTPSPGPGQFTGYQMQAPFSAAPLPSQSPYAQQAAQAQMLFQSMTNGNPFGSA